MKGTSGFISVKDLTMDTCPTKITAAEMTISELEKIRIRLYDLYESSSDRLVRIRGHVAGNAPVKASNELSQERPSIFHRLDEKVRLINNIIDDLEAINSDHNELL